MLDESGLADEAKEAAEIRRSLDLTSNNHKRTAADGMAKSIKVGTGTKAMQQQRRKMHELDDHSGAESKTIQTIRTGRSPQKGDKSTPGDEAKGDSKGVAPGKLKLVSKNQRVASDSKAYEKTMGSLSAELGGSGERNDFKAAAGSGDQGVYPGAGAAGRLAEAKEGRTQNRSKSPRIRPTSANANVNANADADGTKEKAARMLTKAEAVALHEEKRKKKMEEERSYAEAQARRFHRASVNGKSFDTMLRRAERAHEKNVAKAEAKRLAEAEAEKQAASEREERRKAHLNKPLNKVGEMSWAEMQEAQENQRKEAAERRKQEMAASSKAPSGTFAKEADKKHRDAAKQAETDRAATFTFKAADPEKVTARLEKQHMTWLRTLEHAKERASEKSAQAALATVGKTGKDPAAAMEFRASQLAAKREQRLADKKARENALREKELEKKRKAQEKLFNEKTPESGRRLTKSAQIRAELVRKALEKEEKDKAIASRKQKQKEKSEREMSLILKSIVEERDRERKEKLPGEFREISPAQMQEHIKNAKNEFKNRLKENKKRLEEVLSNRPSLLERHEQDIAQRTAGTKALSKVATAVGDGEFDFFNEDEAAKLGVMGA